ncbi:MAG: hypothetical protein K4571_18855 [Deltaproteobacteria bacterium]
MLRRYATLFKHKAVIIGVLALPLVYAVSRYNYNLIHILFDGVSIIIAVSVFMIIWHSRHLLDNHYFLFVGIALLFFAFLDLLHLLGNKNMGIFPEYGNLGPTFYIASRYVLSISLMIAPFFINRRINTTRIVTVYALVSSIILLAIFYWQVFPVTMIEGAGLTPFKVISDCVICVILLIAVVLLFANRRSFNSRVFWLMAASIILSIIAGLAFTLYRDPFSISNLIGHVFQVASFYLIYLALIETSLTRPQEILYRQLKRNEEELLRNLKQLNHANLALKQEIAHRKRVEAKLKERTYQLENANKELESFSYSVSHDLHAPLRGVDGFSRILEKDYAEKLDDEGKRILGIIRVETKRMGQLIDDLLSFSRMGRREMVFTEIDMTELAQNVFNELSAAIPERKTQIRVGTLPPACGDFATVRQLFVNLIANALKFTRPKDTAIIEVGSRMEQGETIYFVRDNGVGFDMHYVHKLFGVFRRLHTDAEFEGTGAGLAIVRRIVQRHGGRIWAESEVGNGASFFFTLPVRQAPESAGDDVRDRAFAAAAE